MSRIDTALARFRPALPAFDATGLMPLRIAGKCLGQVAEPAAALLMRRAQSLIAREGDALVLRDEGMDAAQRSRALAEAVRPLAQAGLVPGWRGEDFAVLDAEGRPLARLERAAFRVLGLQSRAAHINGFRRDGRLWIARRSADKATDPNRLDNLAAGGIAAGETPRACALRELWEEAGVPAALAARASGPHAALRSLRREPEGVHDEILYCFDLELPEDFVPANRDGEVSSFDLFEPAAVAECMAALDLTWDAAMVCADWLARRLPRTAGDADR
jgi:8-oxo-dGTP pyrophosphatase MutT (NUDIX family)